MFANNVCGNMDAGVRVVRQYTPNNSEWSDLMFVSITMMDYPFTDYSVIS